MRGREGGEGGREEREEREGGKEKMESYSLSSTSNTRKCNQNGLQTSRILNFMTRQNCTPRSISYFCSAGLAVFSDSLERFHSTGALRVASHP